MPSTQFIATTALIAGAALQGCSDKANYPSAKATITQVNSTVNGTAFGFAGDDAKIEFTCMSVSADKKNYTDWTACYNDANSLMFTKLPAGKDHKSDFYSLNSTLKSADADATKAANYNATLTLSASWVKDTEKVGSMKGDKNPEPQQIGEFATKHDLCAEPVVWDATKGPVTAYKIVTKTDTEILIQYKNIYFDRTTQAYVQEDFPAVNCSLADGNADLCKSDTVCSFDFKTQCTYDESTKKCNTKDQKECSAMSQKDCDDATTRCSWDATTNKCNDNSTPKDKCAEFKTEAKCPTDGTCAWITPPSGAAHCVNRSSDGL
jgi:hypothetical protein